MIINYQARYHCFESRMRPIQNRLPAGKSWWSCLLNYANRGRSNYICRLTVSLRGHSSAGSKVNMGGLWFYRNARAFLVLGIARRIRPMGVFQSPFLNFRRHPRGRSLETFHLRHYHFMSPQKPVRKMNINYSRTNTWEKKRRQLFSQTFSGQEGLNLTEHAQHLSRDLRK